MESSTKNCEPNSVLPKKVDQVEQNLIGDRSCLTKTFNPQSISATKEATSDNIPLGNQALTVLRKRTIHKIDTADCAKTIAEKNNKKPESNNSLSLSPTIDPPIANLQVQGNQVVTLHLAQKSGS